MKTIIRKNTFETNSSSSHSLVIGRRTQPILEVFPKNSEQVYRLKAMAVAYGDEIYVKMQRLQSEVDKARFMLNIIASHIDSNEDLYPEVSYYSIPEEGALELKDFTYQRDYFRYLSNRLENPNRTFETLIAQKPFVWFKEVLEEETGTKFEFVKPSDNYFPYYDCAHDECNDLDDIVGINWLDETRFKARMKEIVFDEDIVILDVDVPYGSMVDLTI